MLAGPAFNARTVTNLALGFGSVPRVRRSCPEGWRDVFRQRLQHRRR